MKARSALFICILATSCFGNANKPQTSHLDKIIANKTLRVGTPGDYAPFAFQDAAGSYQGLDIELVRDLAKTLDVDIQFVSTSWPNLMVDLQADRFDIAVGGISKNLERQKTALFSESYILTGKAPIARCADAPKFTTLASIDQPGVRVIVNPGGTNEKFVKKNIKNAQILVHPDNKTIFTEIAQNMADVMITDAIEVRWAARQNPELCATMSKGTFDQFEKAFLMPRDFVLKAYIDTWFNQIRLDGTLSKIMTEILSATDKKPPLNSEMIQSRFGSYGVKVLFANTTTRLSSLYSTHDGQNVTRTLALTVFPNPIDPRLATEHKLITEQGQSIGSTFKNAGWTVEKSHLYYGTIPPTATTKALMQDSSDNPLATDIYQMSVSKDGLTIPYATITEVHHPEYLNIVDLWRLYGPAQTGSDPFQALLTDWDAALQSFKLE